MLPTEMDEHFLQLGCTTSDPDSLLIHGFERQIATDGINGPTYLTALARIAEDSRSDALQIHVASARSRGLWSTDDESKAYAALGFGSPGESIDPGVLSEDIISEEFNKRMEQPGKSLQERVELREAASLVAKARGSDLLKVMVQSTSVDQPKMSLDQAYSLLNVPADTADDNLQGACAVYVYVHSSTWW